jgi:hypothetical protein
MKATTGASTMTITTKWTHSLTKETRIRHRSNTKNLAYDLFYKLRDTSVPLQTDGEVRQDKQLDELLMAKRNIEDTQHDFTTSEQFATEPEQSSQLT